MMKTNAGTNINKRNRVLLTCMLFLVAATSLVGPMRPGTGKRCKVHPQGYVGLCEQPENDRSHI